MILPTGSQGNSLRAGYHLLRAFQVQLVQTRREQSTSETKSPIRRSLKRLVAGLEADILRGGGVIARSPAGATVVNLDVNFIAWGPRDKPPGLLGTAAGILAIPPIVIGDSAPMSTWTAANAAAFTAVGIGMLTDLAIALTPTMNAEAIWSATVVTEDQIVLRLEEPVYIRDKDIPLYRKTASLAPTDSWTTQRPLTSRQIRYAP